MLWGANGQLAPRQYPADWFKANDILNQQAGVTRTLFLPWHLYLHTDFAGRTIANPASAFFDTPVVISDDPELPGASIDKPSELSRHIDKLLRNPPSAQVTQDAPLAAQLARLGITNIILAHENDYRTYKSFVNQSGMQPLLQTPTLTLYSLQHNQESRHAPTR